MSNTTPESTMILSEADRTDLSNVIYENVLAMEEVPASEFIDALIDRYPLLMAEGVSWGFGDTVVRENVCASCSEMLISRDWPYNGDNLSDEQIETFRKDLKKSYDEFVAKNTK